MADFWQEPHVNLFKHYGIGQWKKCHKEGDVVSYMDRLIKVITMSISAGTGPSQDLLLFFFQSPAYRISGIVPANNFIVIPKHSSQSAGLVGKHLYILFKPLPSQFFTIHLEVS